MKHPSNLYNFHGAKIHKKIAQKYLKNTKMIRVNNNPPHLYLLQAMAVVLILLSLLGVVIYVR